MKQVRIGEKQVRELAKIYGCNFVGGCGEKTLVEQDGTVHRFKTNADALAFLVDKFMF